MTGFVGEVFYFDPNKKVWINNNGYIKNPPKKVDLPLEAYTYSSGEITCSEDILVIPHPSYSFVVEIKNVTCQKLDKSQMSAKYVPADLKISPDQILPTFKFTN